MWNFFLTGLVQKKRNKKGLTSHASLYILGMYMALWIIVNDYNIHGAGAENYNET